MVSPSDTPADPSEEPAPGSEDGEPGLELPRGVNPFAERRAAARLAAVQALYQLELSGRGAQAVVAEFREHRFSGAQSGPVDADFFQAIVTGVVANQADVDTRIKAVLREGWKLERLDATVRAILRAGVFELTKRADIPAPVSISAYLAVAHDFFEGPEPGFVNAALDAAAKAVAGEAEA